MNKEASDLSMISNSAPTRKEQPSPLIFRYGRHMCPGRGLAKLEILLFLKEFLTKFEYNLVAEQVSWESKYL